MNFHAGPGWFGADLAGRFASELTKEVLPVYLAMKPDATLESYARDQGSYC